MTSQDDLYKFNEIYENTYRELLKFIIIKCHNISDAKDIMQETYLVFWKIMNKKVFNNINMKSYLYGIASNKIKKHYTLHQKIKTISLF